MNVDVKVLVVGVEVDMFGIDCVWLLVEWNVRIHLHMDVCKYLLHFVVKVRLLCASNMSFPKLVCVGISWWAKVEL